MYFIFDNDTGSYIKLIYSESGEIYPIEGSRVKVHEEYWINDNWYIFYYFIDR